MSVLGWLIPWFYCYWIELQIAWRLDLYFFLSFKHPPFNTDFVSHSFRIQANYLALPLVNSMLLLLFVLILTDSLCLYNQKSLSLGPKLTFAFIEELGSVDFIHRICGNTILKPNVWKKQLLWHLRVTFQREISWATIYSLEALSFFFAPPTPFSLVDSV